MVLWEKNIYERFSRLTSSNPTLNIKGAKELLCEDWGVQNVEFVEKSGEPIHGRTLVSNALQQPIKVRITIELPCEPPPDITVPQGKASEPPKQASLSPPNREQTVLGERRGVDPLVQRVVAGLEIQERRRDFVWAGFVVKELLPGLGIEAREVQALFDRLVEDGVLLLEKRPNPNNPDFQTTCVKLNRESDVVRAVLSRNGGSAKAFQPVPIRGEPASATLIRERR